VQFIYLLITVACGGLAMGYTKFYFLSYMSHEVYTMADKVWIIQIVGAIMTGAAFLAYFVGAPLSSAFQKRHVLLISFGGAALLLTIGILSGWSGTVWLYTALIGWQMGIFKGVRRTPIPYESKRSGRSTEYINGRLNSVFLISMLGGIPLAVALYNWSPDFGAWFGVAVLASGAFFGSLCVYEGEKERLKKYSDVSCGLMGSSLKLLRQYPVYLLSTPLLTGMASVLSLAVTVYAEEMMLGTDVECSFVSVYAAIGIMVGNIISPKFTKVRYPAVSVSGLIMVILTLCIPSTVTLMAPSPIIQDNVLIYWIITAIIIVHSACLGFSSNLMDSEYLRLVHRDKNEGGGTAMLSAMSSFFIFGLGALVSGGIIKGNLGYIGQYYFLAGVITLSTAMVIMLAVKKRAPVLTP